MLRLLVERCARPWDGTDQDRVAAAPVLSELIPDGVKTFGIRPGSATMAGDGFDPPMCPGSIASARTRVVCDIARVDRWMKATDKELRELAETTGSRLAL